MFRLLKTKSSIGIIKIRIALLKYFNRQIEIDRGYLDEKIKECEDQKTYFRTIYYRNKGKIKELTKLLNDD